MRRQLGHFAKADSAYAAGMAKALRLKELMGKNEFDKETTAFIRD